MNLIMCNVFQQNEVEGNSEICIILFAWWLLVDGVSVVFIHMYMWVCLPRWFQTVI